MAFIRCRQSNRAKSYQFVETYREDGKVKQRVLANLGPHPTVELALENACCCVARAERYVEHCKHGWTRRGRPVHPKHLLNAEKDLARHRHDLERLEAVVSETSRRRDVVDTTPSMKLRRSVVRLDKSRSETNLTAHLSGLQAEILKTMLLKRVPGARGCDASQTELRGEIWGWNPRRKVRCPRKTRPTVLLTFEPVIQCRAVITTACFRTYHAESIALHAPASPAP